MNRLRTFEDFVNEGAEAAQPITRPTTKPKVTPTTRPSRPSPYRKDKPSTVPGPKASADDVANRFLKLTENNLEIKAILKKKYQK